MKLREWPNKLGWDWRDYEVMKHSEGFSVRSDSRCMFVPFELTRDPEEALRLCVKYGCSVKELDELEYAEAQSRSRNQWKRLITDADLQRFGMIHCQSCVAYHTPGWHQ